MYLAALPFRSPIDVYQQQAEELLAAHQRGEAAAIDLFHRKHPRFLDDKITWRPKFISDSEIRDAILAIDDARLVVARSHSFRDWSALNAYVDAVRHDPSILAFESAVEAVIAGDEPALAAALRDRPALIAARSNRVCYFDPPVHGATLLHYVAANGVEDHRQVTPPNIVAITRILLEAGADPDALALMYGAEWTTLSLLASSSPPARAGVQVPLIELLLDFGAALEGRGRHAWGAPSHAALAFGMLDAARAPVRRGAPIDLPVAAGLGLNEDAARTLAGSSAEERHRALSLAAQQGHVAIVQMLLNSGEDPNRFNPEGNHPHTTPLHQAILGGHDPVVRLLIERGARLDIRDRIWDGTPLGWALYAAGAAQPSMVEYLRSLGAPE